MFQTALRSLLRPASSRRAAPSRASADALPASELASDALASRLGRQRRQSRLALDTDAAVRLGVLRGIHLDPRAALARYGEQHAAATLACDLPGAAEIEGRIACAYIELGDLVAATDAIEAALELVRRSDRDAQRAAGPLRANLHAALGLISERSGDLVRALTCYELDLRSAQSRGDLRTQTVALAHIGRLHRARGTLGSAVDALVAGLRLAECQPDRELESELWWELGLAFADRGDMESASVALSRRLAFVRAIDHPLTAQYADLCGLVSASARSARSHSGPEGAPAGAARPSSRGEARGCRGTRVPARARRAVHAGGESADFVGRAASDADARAVPEDVASR